MPVLIQVDFPITGFRYPSTHLMKLYFLVFITAVTSMISAELPYKAGELQENYVLTESQVRSSISDIKRMMGIKRQPKGAVFECYQIGVGGI